MFTYDTGIFRSAIAKTKAAPVDWYIYHDRMYRGISGTRPVGILKAMIGAPAASMNLEELIAFGAKRIYEMGHAGAVDRRLEPGDVVVLDGALSDEGASKHYYRASPMFTPSPSLTRRLSKSLSEMGIEHTKGRAWTVDAVYRETVEKLVRFRRRGALVVNMESSAVFAVAKYRGIDAASVQVVSDALSEEGWKPAFHENVVGTRGLEVLEGVLKAIAVAD